MSTRNSRLIQYGRRTSTKHKKSHSSSPEPTQKRQKLVDPDDDKEPEQRLKDAQNRLSVDTIRHQSTGNTARTSDSSPIRASLQAPSNPASDILHKSPSRTYISKSRTRDGSPPNVEDVEVLVPTRPNTPTRSPSPGASGRLHRTPSRKPKDLSGIFTPFPQFSSPSSCSPGKSITKRMLVRFRTEPFSPPSSTSLRSPRSTLTPALSLPNIAANAPQPSAQLPSPPSPPPTVCKPVIRTYSQSRSFLVTLPPPIASHQLPSTDNRDLCYAHNTDIEPTDQLRESYADLRARWGVDHSEDDPSHISGATDLMSVTELRSRGESRRFLDEVGYLFEGLEEPGMALSVRRSSAVEIVVKMCDGEFVRKAKAADFIGHAWEAMRRAGAGDGDGDKILNACLAFFVALVARDKRDINDLTRKDGFFDVMIRLLQTAKKSDGLLSISVADAPKTSLPKVERVTLSNLRSAIEKTSELSMSSSPPSTRALASYALSSVTPSYFPEQLLLPVLERILAELAPLCPPIGGNTSEPGLLLMTTRNTLDLEHIDHCLKIFDAFLLRLWGESLGWDEINAARQTLCKGLVALSTVPAFLDSDSQHCHTARQCTESSFRVLMNLSHLNAEWCRLLVADEFFLPALVREILSQFEGAVKAGVNETEQDVTEAQARAFDRQCLVLALLSNVVFAVEEAQDLLRETVLSPSCPGGPHCLKLCCCPERINAIELLTSLFIKTGLKLESPVAPDLVFFRCHLAALLCLVAVGNRANQYLVRQALPGMDVRDKSDTLSPSIQLFLGFYSEAGGRIELEVSRPDVAGELASRVALGLEALFA